MKKPLFFAILFILLCLSACGAENKIPQQDDTKEISNPPFAPDTPTEKSVTTTEKNEDTATTEMEIIIDGQVFTTELNHNPSAQALTKRLPLTLAMQEMNGNEKYYYFPNPLPFADEKVEKIEAGDIMLYGSDCLVLFYQSFATSYGYTKIGKVYNPERLAKALGKEAVTVIFREKTLRK